MVLPKWTGPAVRQRRISSGRSGLVVQIGYNEVAKFRDDNHEGMLQKERNIARALKSAGVRVPQPYEVSTCPFTLGERYEERPGFVMELILGTPYYLLQGGEREIAKRDMDRQYELARRAHIMAQDKEDANALWVPHIGIYLIDFELWQG